MSKENSIYPYLDYRAFLKDRFQAIKARHKGFSYRYFCHKTGIKSSGFLKLVMDGKRNLGEEGIQAVCNGFNLTDREALYFTLLVKFNQAKNLSDKDAAYQQMLTLGARAVRYLNKDQYELFTHWYAVAILELLRLDTSEVKDVDWLSRHLDPEVGVREVKQALATLQALGLVSRAENGSWQRHEPMLAAKDDVVSLALMRFHQQMSTLAARKVESEPPDAREFSALTMAVSAEQFRRVKDELRDLRKRLHSILESETLGPGAPPKDVVAHVNLQLFAIGHSFAARKTTASTSSQENL